jgi:hypothetical protein
MVLEVLLRILANGRAFFRSFYSAIDAILLLLCIATLVLITTGCSNTQRDEAIIDTILLTIRNTVQLCRFAAMIQRYVFLIYEPLCHFLVLTLPH